MNLADYFENAKGVGVLATADAEGRVNVAVYARPHFLDPADENSAYADYERASVLRQCSVQLPCGIPIHRGRRRIRR